MRGALTAGLAVLLVTLMALLGPLVGLSPWITTLLVIVGLGGLSLDAARFGGRGGHLLAEALPGGLGRLRRIALHEAAHALVASEEGVAVAAVHVGSLACLRAGLAAGGTTVLEPPASARLPLEELRSWSRVLLAGMAAETVIYGSSEGGADDRSLLGRLWGLSGQDVSTAQMEQRRARREVEQWLRQRRPLLEAEADRLARHAPRLGWPQPGRSAPPGGTGRDPAPTPAERSDPMVVGAAVGGEATAAVEAAAATASPTVVSPQAPAAQPPTGDSPSSR
ncbi:MAG: hypothetical protein ACO3B3_01840 [Cyanobium sp.]